MEEYRRDAESQALEETQWWIGCLANVWSALLSDGERSFLSNDLTVTSSQGSLASPSCKYNFQRCTFNNPASMRLGTVV